MAKRSCRELPCCLSPEVPCSLFSFPHLLDLCLIYVQCSKFSVVLSIRIRENMFTSSSWIWKSLCNFRNINFFKYLYYIHEQAQRAWVTLSRACFLTRHPTAYMTSPCFFAYNSNCIYGTLLNSCHYPSCLYIPCSQVLIYLFSVKSFISIFCLPFSVCPCCCYHIMVFDGMILFL